MTRRANDRVQPRKEVHRKAGCLEPQLKKKISDSPTPIIFLEGYSAAVFPRILDLFFHFFLLLYNHKELCDLLCYMFCYVMHFLQERKKCASQFSLYWHQWLLAQMLHAGFSFFLSRAPYFHVVQFFYFFWASFLFWYFFSLCSPSNSFLALN